MDTSNINNNNSSSSSSKKKRKYSLLYNSSLDDNNNNNDIEYNNNNSSSNRINKIIILFGIIIALIVILVIVIIVYLVKHPNSDTVIVVVYPTIVISIDSFRTEYFNRGLTPNLQQFIDDNSFRAQYTTAQFPSKTFPNHYSIATGLYPESHGIVSNNMYDPTIDKIFTTTSNESLNTYWWWGEPIWVTAKKSNIKTACYYWPGCGVKISNIYPDYNIIPFNISIKSSQVFNQLYNWRVGSGSGSSDGSLNNSSSEFEIPKLILGYVHEIDDEGHEYGPDSKQVNDSISLMDSNIGIFINQLKQSNLYDKTNIIFLSDHGMIGIPSTKYLYLDDITSDKSISSKFYTPDAIFFGYSEPVPVISIFPNDTRYSVDYLYNQLNKNKSKFIQFYKKEDIPNRYYFNLKSNSRIPPILGVANPGYSIIVSRDTLYPGRLELGNHGYDPDNNEMHSIFIARGPNIKSSGSKDNSTSTSLKEFKNTEIYNLLAQLIGIQSKNFAPTNGTSLLIDKLYKSSSS